MHKLPVQLTLSETHWGIRYWLFQMIFLPKLLSVGLYLLFPDYPRVWLDIAYFSVNFGAVVWIFRSYLRQSARSFGNRWRSAAACVAIALPCYYAMTYGLSLLTVWLMPEFYNVNDAAISVSADQSFWLMAAGTVLLAPAAEELLYRGLLFGSLHRHSRGLAYAVSALVFCSIHVSGYVGDYSPALLAACFLQYLPGGLVLAWAYERSGSIFTPIAIHMIINAIGTFAMR